MFRWMGTEVQFLRGVLAKTLEVIISMEKPLREKSKDELKFLLEYFEKAKKSISDTMENIEEVYNSVIEKYESTKKELKGREDGET